MRSLRFLMGLLVVVFLALTGCDGGGGSSGGGGTTPDGGGGGTTPVTGFTAELLGTNTIMYFAETDAEGTDQTIYTITKNSDGTYNFKFEDFGFDPQGNYIPADYETAELPAVLQDGKLVLTTPDGPAALELKEVTPNVSWLVSGPGAPGDEEPIWTEVWYYNKPAGWKEVGGVTPVTSFTAELLNTNPTLYFAETDGGFKDQSTYTITSTGGGTYTFKVVDSTFDLQGNWLGSLIGGPFPAVLQDGKLVVNMEGELIPLELKELNPNAYWVVSGPGDVLEPIWTETWYYNKPQGWIEVPFP